MENVSVLILKCVLDACNTFVGLVVLRDADFFSKTNYY